MTTPVGRRIVLAAVACGAVIAAGCASNPATGGADVVTMSEKKEIDIGRQMHPKVLQQYGRYNDERLQAYVNDVGQRLAAKGDRPGITWTFTVLDSQETNAFALPGGYIYITRGIMSYLNSEAELAAVLGHEIGHVTARHAVRQQTGATAAGVGATLIAVLTGSGSLANIANVAGSALISGYGRDMELEADSLGARYIGNLGYDPEAMIDVVRLLKNQEMFEIQRAREENREPRVYHGVFSSHPDNDTRLKEVVASAGEVARGEQRQPGRVARGDGERGPAREERRSSQADDERPEAEERQLEQRRRLGEVEARIDRLDHRAERGDRRDHLPERIGRSDDQDPVCPDPDTPRECDAESIGQLPVERTRDPSRERR